MPNSGRQGKRLCWVHVGALHCNIACIRQGKSVRLSFPSSLEHMSVPWNIFMIMPAYWYSLGRPVCRAYVDCCIITLRKRQKTDCADLATKSSFPVLRVTWMRLSGTAIPFGCLATCNLGRSIRGCRKAVLLRAVSGFTHHAQEDSCSLV